MNSTLSKFLVQGAGNEEGTETVSAAPGDRKGDRRKTENGPRAADETTESGDEEGHLEGRSGDGDEPVWLTLAA